LKKNSLATSIVGLNIENPIILASGILGYTVESFQRVAAEGAGAIITKSIGLAPRRGYSNPTVVQLKTGLINAMGLPNPGIDSYTNEISEAKKALTIPLIVSVYGYSAEDYIETSRKALKAGADAIELNVSCPHVKETGLEISQNPDILTQVVKGVKKAIDKPIIVKLSPNVTDIVALAKAAVDAGADALTAINTLRAMAIDIETTKPILSNKIGGLSGPALKSVALRCIYELYENLKTPIIGCGGITDWKDAIEFFLAGASAIQVGTAIASNDLTIFNSINRGVSRYLKKKKIRSLKEIVGLSHLD
jgi:dihydroorotate dehydrogenase (NAD+) catalytic subunit